MMITSPSLRLSALLNLVALVGAKARVVRRAQLIAGGRRRSLVALANDLGVLVVPLATSTQEGRHLDACAAHLHVRGRWVCHVGSRECAANIQSALARAISEHGRTLNINL